MKKIKDFVYLNEQKMYSLSSQLFEGVTDYVLSESSSHKEEGENQKGPVGSGRVLANAMLTGSKSIERKFVHDHAFSLFEKALLDEQRILDVDASTSSAAWETINSSGVTFVRVRQRAILADYPYLTDMISGFNEYGAALLRLQLAAADIDERKDLARQQLEAMVLQDNKEKSRRVAALDKAVKEFGGLRKNKSAFSSLLYSQGMSLESDLTESFAVLSEKFYKQQFELLQYFSELSFTSCVDPSNIRGGADLLLRRFSALTQRELVVVGVVTQYGAQDSLLDVLSSVEGEGMKEAMIKMVSCVNDMQGSMAGRKCNEVVIDPIAAYFEI